MTLSSPRTHQDGVNDRADSTSRHIVPIPAFDGMLRSLEADISQMDARRRTLADKTQGMEPYKSRVQQVAERVAMAGASVAILGMATPFVSSNITEAATLTAVGALGGLGAGLISSLHAIRQRLRLPTLMDGLRDAAYTTRLTQGAQEKLRAVRQYIQDATQDVSLSGVPEVPPPMSLSDVKSMLEHASLARTAKMTVIAASVSLYGPEKTREMIPDTLYGDNRLRSVLNLVSDQYDAAVWSRVSRTLDADRASGATLDTYLDHITPYLQLSHHGGLPLSCLVALTSDAAQQHGAPAVQHMAQVLQSGSDSARNQAVLMRETFAAYMEENPTPRSRQTSDTHAASDLAPLKAGLTALGSSSTPRAAQ